MSDLFSCSTVTHSTLPSPIRVGNHSDAGPSYNRSGAVPNVYGMRVRWSFQVPYAAYPRSTARWCWRSVLCQRHWNEKASAGMIATGCYAAWAASGCRGWARGGAARDLPRRHGSAELLAAVGCGRLEGLLRMEPGRILSFGRAP